MKDLVIVGAGDYGLTTYDVVQEINRIVPTWNVKGFIDDKDVDLKAVKIDVPLLGTVKDCQPTKDEFYILGIAVPSVKEKVASLLESKGAQFATVIGPRANVNESAEIGVGSVIAYGSVGRCAKVGKFVNIFGTTLGNLSEVGDYSTLTNSVNITTARIGKRVFIGSHAVVLGNACIGDDAFVCAGSIVFSSVKPGQRVIGYPAARSPFI